MKSYIMWAVGRDALPFTPREPVSLLAATTPGEQSLTAADPHANAPTGTVWCEEMCL